MSSFFAHLSEQLSNYHDFGPPKLPSVMMTKEDIKYERTRKECEINKCSDILDEHSLFDGHEAFKNVSADDVAVDDEKEIDNSVHLDGENEKIMCTLPMCGSVEEYMSNERESALDFVEQQSSQYLDFVSSIPKTEILKDLTEKADQNFESLGLITKRWAVSSSNLPEQVAEECNSVKMAGMVWYPQLSLLEIPLSQLNFSDLSRGRLVAGSNVHNGSMEMEEFVPKCLTRELNES